MGTSIDWESPISSRGSIWLQGWHPWTRSGQPAQPVHFCHRDLSRAHNLNRFSKNKQQSFLWGSWEEHDYIWLYDLLEAILGSQGGILKVDTWKAKQAEERKQDLDGITKPHQDLPDASPVPLGFYVPQTKYSLSCLSQPWVVSSYSPSKESCLRMHLR